MQLRDHPRSRGVYAELIKRDPFVTGIIPARAGFTSGRRNNRLSATDHPRSRGVYAMPPGSIRQAAGSSPLARGLPPHVLALMMAHRIIPARAGFTVRPLLGRQRPQDHPRSRGVYCECLTPDLRLGGSSPLARGLPWGYSGSKARARIIPARAGFTDASLRPANAEWDHPRSRGVYGGAMTAAQRALGSSPLARGLRERISRHVPRVGIIPARAGFTAWWRCST